MLPLRALVQYSGHVRSPSHNGEHITSQALEGGHVWGNSDDAPTSLICDEPWVYPWYDLHFIRPILLHLGKQLSPAARHQSGTVG